METKQFELTEKRAISMLSSNASIPKVGVPYNGVEVRNVSHTDKEGNPWTYKDEDGNITGEYAIVNLKAQTPYHQAESLALFQNGELQEAVNKTISINVNPAEAQEIDAVGVGTLTMGTAYSKNLEQDIIVAKRFKPAAAIDVKSVDFNALLAKAAEAANTGTPNEGDA